MGSSASTARGRSGAAPLISVIVPAYNAAQTLRTTLNSVLAQSFEDFEVIVVDDGSTDGTAEIADLFCAHDARFRRISQRNMGVAAARNAGLELCRGQFVAPLDADDTWHPDKLARQLDCFLNGPEDLGLVYAWSVVVDDKGRPFFYMRRRYRGYVLHEICRSNFIGSASNPLIRRAAIAGAGGYDINLRARGMEGCEDWKLNVLLAAEWRYEVVEESLVYYRATAASMSAATNAMVSSHTAVRDELSARFPEAADKLRAHVIDLLLWSLVRQAHLRDLKGAIATLGLMFSKSPMVAAATMLRAPFSLGRRSWLRARARSIRPRRV